MVFQSSSVGSDEIPGPRDGDQGCKPTAVMSSKNGLHRAGAGLRTGGAGV